MGSHIFLWVHIWNLQSGENESIFSIQQFTNKRPTAKYNDLPGAWGDSILIHEPKDSRTKKINPHARGPVMYLGPIKKTKDAHYFYDPKICKLLTRRSLQRVRETPPEWRQNKVLH